MECVSVFGSLMFQVGIVSGCQDCYLRKGQLEAKAGPDQMMPRGREGNAKARAALVGPPRLKYLRRSVAPTHQRLLRLCDPCHTYPRLARLLLEHLRVVPWGGPHVRPSYLATCAPAATATQRGPREGMLYNLHIVACAVPSAISAVCAAFREEARGAVRSYPELGMLVRSYGPGPASV